MNDFAAADTAPIETPSTVIDGDASTSSGGGAPRVIEEEAKPEPSLRDAIKGAVKADAKPEPAPKAEKAEKPPKVEAEAKDPDKSGAGDAKAAKAEVGEAVEGGGDAAATEGEGEANADAGDAEGGDNAEPKTGGKSANTAPERFLPRAKELWRNVPNEVRSEIQRMSSDHEAELAAHKEAVERYDSIRVYDELARSNGRDLNYTLDKVVQIEQLMQKSPIAALNMLLTESGPRKADGSALSLYEVAEYIVSQGQQGYQGAIQQANQQMQQHQQQQQGNQQVQQLQQQVQQLQQQQVAASVIEPFRAANPRFDELKADIAFFLQSDKVPQGLSAADRLAAAYDYAVRINPSPVDYAASPDPAPSPANRADTFGGSKSVKSSPGKVTEPEAVSEGSSVRDLLRSNLKQAKRS